MFTKLFKKSHDPYELPGRWYKIAVDKDGVVPELSDKVSFINELSYASYRLRFPEGWTIIDFDMYVYPGDTGTSAGLFATRQIYLFTDGTQAITLSAAINNFTHPVIIYVHAVHLTPNGSPE